MSEQGEPNIPDAQARALTLIAHFLGPEAVGGSVFELLGLPRGRHEAETVRGALQARLDRVRAHPDGETDAADEVRLALHTAAAQLIEALRQDQAQRGAAANIGEAGRPQGFREEAMLIIAQDGGFNDQTLRRLTALAQRRGLTAADAMTLLASVGQAGHSAAAEPIMPIEPVRHAAPPPTRSPAGWRDEEEEGYERGVDLEVRRAVREAMWVGGFILVGLVGVIVLAIVIFSGRGATPPGPPAPAAASGAGSGASASAAQPSSSAGGESTESTETAASPVGGPADPEPVMVDAGKVLAKLRGASVGIKAVTTSTAGNGERGSAPVGGAAEHAAAFDEAVATAASLWPRYDLSQRRAIDDAVIEYVYAVASWPDLGPAAIDTIAAPSRALAEGQARVRSSEVWPAAWSAGMLGRLSAERNLPRTITQPIERALAAALGVDRRAGNAALNDAGIEGALRAMSVRLVSPRGEAATKTRQDSSRALRQWTEAVAAITPAEGDAAANERERLMIDALESLMVFAPEPDERIDVYDAIGSLAAATTWRTGGPARPRLLDWLRDRRVSAADIRVLTSAIVGRSRAEHVEPSMILSAGAVEGGREDRARLREAYAKAWGLGGFEHATDGNGGGRDEALAAWGEAARDLLTRSQEDATPDAALAQAAALSRLHEAAWALWDGDAERADGLIDEARRRFPPEKLAKTPGSARPSGMDYVVLSGQGVGTAPHGGRDEASWAIGYFQAERNIPLRLKRLEELEFRGGELGSVDAEVLAEVAVMGTPEQVRSAAQKVVKVYAGQAVLVDALLDVLPRAPRIESVSQVIEQVAGRRLPASDDPSWPVLARRALVERLIEMLAAGGAADAGGLSVDESAAALAASYRHAAGMDLDEETDAPGGEARGGDVLAGTSALIERLKRDAEAYAPCPGAPLPLAELLRRADGRRRLASGPVQAFAADQVELGDLLAYTVCGERPGRADEVAATHARAGVRRRAATHVFSQVREGERLVLELWLVRFGQEVQP